MNNFFFAFPDICSAPNDMRHVLAVSIFVLRPRVITTRLLYEMPTPKMFLYLYRLRYLFMTQIRSRQKRVELPYDGMML